MIDIVLWCHGGGFETMTSCARALLLVKYNIARSILYNQMILNCWFYLQDELKVLKQQQHAMQDLHHNMMSASASNPALSNSTSTSSLSSSALAADDRDFVDVISSQHEINRLSNEVSRLTAECQHWKQMADINNSQQVRIVYYQQSYGNKTIICQSW